jgi:tetratricopeptide (TPR) repeat protein
VASTPSHERDKLRSQKESPIELFEPALPSRHPVTVWVARRRLHPLKLAAALFLLAALAGAVAIGLGPDSPSSVAELQLRQKVVVAPFRVAGAAGSLAYLRDGIVELLSTRLADDTSARAVDAGAVLSAWRAAGLTSTAAVPRDTVVKLAARLGAERVVIGSVVGTPQRVILRASVIAVPSVAVSGEAMVEGPADSISALIDGLAARLLVSEAGEDERLASYTTASLPALRAYLAGQSAFRQNNYTTALRHYQTALREDSTFALAALRLAIVADRLNEDAQKRRGVALGWAARDALSERDLALLFAFAGPRYPLPSQAPEQLAAWQRLADLAPNDAEAWYVLGASLFHDGAAAGLLQADERAAASLARALSIDPNHAPARLLLIQLALWPGREPPRQDLALDSALRGPLRPFAPFLRWRLAIANADTAGLRRIRSTLPRLTPGNLRAMLMASQFEGVGLLDGAQALGLLRERAGRRADRVDLLLAQHSQWVQQGRPQAALEATIRLGSLLGSHAHLRLRILDALYAEGDSAAAAAAASELMTTSGLAAGAFASATSLADRCVLAQWHIARGDTAGVETAIGALREAPLTIHQLLPVSAAPPLCADLLEAALAISTGRADALSRVQRLDSLVLTSQTAGDAIAYAPLLMARLYQRAGDPRRALVALRKRPYLSGWPRYLATAWREEGRLAQLLHDLPAARDAYDRYLALRTAPEDAIVPQVEQVRRLRAALETSSP